MDHELTPFFTPASSTSHQENADFDEIRRNLLDDLSQSVVADDVSLITMKEDGATLKTNELQHIKVYLRIRPATEVERSSGLVENCVTIENERSVTVTAPQQSHSYRSSLYGVTRQKQCFHFSRVFGEDTTQQQFYDETMKSTINEFIDGQNCLIFSYGVTNSGKTYTIHGDPHDERAGILPRSLNQIFSATVGSHVPGMQFKPVMFGEVARLTAEQVEREEKLKESLLRHPLSSSASNVALSEGGVAGREAVYGDDTLAEADTIMSDDSLESRLSVVSDVGRIGGRVRYTIWASFLEIYNEQLYDLLVPLQLAGNKPVRRTALQLRDDRDGRPYVRGLREVHVASAEDAQRLLDIGRRNLHIASTRLNRASSRSHCIFTLKLIQIVDVANPSVARVASLSFCDLAGSERYQATCAFNERVKEAGNINSSLLTLGRCIDALRRNQSRKESTVQPAPRTAERSSLFSAPQIRRDGQSIAPFRESKLTRIFQNFLCGEGRVTMVINISQCSNVFDETLHALKYSALARQVVLIPSTNAVQSKPIHTNGERRTSSKRQTSLTALKTYSKKRKTEDLETVLESDSVDTVPASSDVTTSIEPLNNRGDDEEELKSDEDEDDCPDDDVSQESSPEGWKEQRQNMVKMIRKLEELLNEERQNSLTREARIRQEVCNEMQQQLVRIENEYQEGLRVREEICEEKFERKMEIYMEAVQKSCKRRRPLDEDEVLSGAGLQAKLSEHVETIRELETRNKELSKELADLHANFQKVCNERDMNVQRLTKAEFFASDAGRKLELLQTEAAQVLVKSSQQIARLETPEEIDKMQAIVSKLEEELKEEKSKQRAEKELKETVDELNGKIKDMECRHELTCRQLRSKLKQYENSAKASDGNSAITGLEVKNENVQIQEELLQLKDKLASSELAVHSLELERDSLQSQVKALHSQNEILMREAEDSKKSVELLTDEVAACKNELQNVRKSCDKDGDELQMLLSSKTSEFDAVKGDLEKKLRDALADQTEANSKLSNSVAVTNELESKLVAVRTELEQCQLEVTEKDEKLKQLEREARLKQEHVAQLEQTVFELTRKLSEAEDERKTEKEQWTTEVSSMKKKITDLEENLTSSEKDNDEAKLQTVLLQSELEANAHQLKALNGELIIMKEQISKGDERERELKSQLNVSTQLAKELQDKGKKVSEELEDLKATMKDKIKEERALVEERLEAKIKHMEMELSSKEKTLQTRYQTIDDLVEKMEKERAGYEIALRDAKSNETVIEQLKLTLSEQELTMQAQDRVIHERDAKVKSLEDSITRLHSENDNLMTQLSAENKRRELELTRQIESSQEQMKEKDIRLREIEKDLKKLERQKLSLEKDVCDVTSELRDCEHNLAERIHELKACQLELEKLRNSKEPNAKSLAKDLIQRDADLLSMRQQLAACNECCQSLREELDKVRERCINSEKQLQLKEQDFSKWRLERDALVTEINKSLSDKDTEIKRLKLAVKSTKRSDTMNVKSDEIEPLKRALNIKDQTIEDLRQQNLQLQKLMSDGPTNQGQVGTKSRTSRSRGPLRVTDHNADISMSILSEGSNAIDLDETSVHSRKKKVQRLTNGLPTTEHLNASPAAGTKGRRRRQCYVTDEQNVIPESPVMMRELRSRRVV